MSIEETHVSCVDIQLLSFGTFDYICKALTHELFNDYSTTLKVDLLGRQKTCLINANNDLNCYSLF